MTPEAQQLIDLFNAAHHGTAHGLAKVLTHVADNYGDPESWEAVPRDRLITLAKQLTADLPAPYGERS